jgi:hypothetical protein
MHNAAAKRSLRGYQGSTFGKFALAFIFFITIGGCIRVYHAVDDIVC